MIDSDMRVTAKLLVQTPLRIDVSSVGGSFGGFIEGTTRYGSDPRFDALYRGVYHIEATGADRVGEGKPTYLEVWFDPAERTIEDIQKVLTEIGITTTHVS